MIYRELLEIHPAVLLASAVSRLRSLIGKHSQSSRYWARPCSLAVAAASTKTWFHCLLALARQRYVLFPVKDQLPSLYLYSKIGLLLEPG